MAVASFGWSGDSNTIVAIWESCGANHTYSTWFSAVCVAYRTVPDRHTCLQRDIHNRTYSLFFDDMDRIDNILGRYGEEAQEIADKKVKKPEKR